MSKNTREHWEKRFENESDVSQWSSRWRLRFYEWAIEHVYERTATFLDVGSGLGYGLHHVCKSHPGWQTTGLDFAWSAVSKAIIPTLNLDVLNDEIPGKYDYVLCVQTLEHFSRPDPLITKLLAATGKELIITVPYREDISFHTEHEFSFDKEYFYQFGHPWFNVRYNRLKVVYGFAVNKRIIHFIKSYFRQFQETRCLCV